MKILSLNWIRLTSTLSKFFSKIHSPWTHKLISAKDYRDIKANLKRGDVLLSRVRGEFSNLGIPGFFTHAAIAYDDTTVIESTTRGVVKTDLIDFVMKKDYIAVLRPVFMSERERDLSAFMAQEQLGKPYDFEFATSDIKAFYCSELVWFCYQKISGSKLFSPKKILGRETVLPQDFITAQDKFIMLWKSK